MSEWLKAHAWKACVGEPYRGFESHSLRHVSNVAFSFAFFREAAGEPAAPKEVPERPINKRRESVSVAQVRRLQAKRLEVVTDDLVQHAGLRDPRLVLVGGQRHNHPSRIGGAKPDGS